MATTQISLYQGNDIWSSLPDTSVTYTGNVPVGWSNKNDEMRGLWISQSLAALAGATINTATLYLYCHAYTGDREGTWYIYRVRCYGGEPDATPYYYDIDDVSWNERDNSGNIAWTTAGAASAVDDIDTGATGASEDNPITPNPVASSWWSNEVTAGVQQALDNCGGYYAFRVSAVMVGLGEAEASYAIFDESEDAYIDIDYTPAAVTFVPQVMIY